jgi:hypothetical protein
MTLFFLHMAIDRFISDSPYKIVQEENLVGLYSEWQRQSEQWQDVETNSRLLTYMGIVQNQSRIRAVCPVRKTAFSESE